MSRSRLVVIGPVPPPAHGVSVSTSLVLANPELRKPFAVEHLDTSDRRSGANINTWDLTNILLGLGALARLVRLLRGERGVVYLSLPQGAPAFLRDSLFVRVAALARWKVAGHLRGGEFHHFYAQRGRLYRWWVRVTLSRIHSVGVLGEGLRVMFEGLVPPERIAVVPNGTPDPGEGDGGRDPELVLFLSNLRERKGLLEAIDAALLVVREHPTARFVFAGSWYDARLEQDARRRAAPAGDSIRFLAPVAGEAKQRLLFSAGILLFPPVEPEGHPRVVLEAMASGLPVVTTDRGAIAETVVHGEGGFVLDEPIPEQLAECVLQLLRDRALWERMGAEARRRYLAAYTEERASRRFTEWLATLAPEGAAARSTSDRTRVP